MFRKSVYLFSVAILGLSLVPSSAWADEAIESAAPAITTELVESPVNSVEQPVAEPEETVVEAPTEQQASIGEEAAELPATENQESNTEEIEVPAEPVAAPEEPAAAEPKTIEPEKKVEPFAAPQQKAARAAIPFLKDDNDGKIVDHEKAITDEEAKISAEYNFMPNFDQLDDIVVQSSAGYTERTSYFVFDLKNAAKNSITVIYKNVGTYNGKVIDMKVTVKDWTVFTGSVYAQLSISKRNGITMNGISDVRLNYSFLDNLTAKAANVSGFFNFTDIDLKQSIDLFDHNNVQNFYVTKGNELYVKTHNGFIRVGEINGDRTNDLNMDHWLTYTYKNISNFDVRYNQDYDSGAVFNYTYQAPIVIEETAVVPETKEPEVVEETPIEEETATDEVVPVKTETAAVSLAAKAEPAKVEVAKTEVKKVEVKKAEPLKQAVLPQTNDKVSSIFITLGGACLFLFTALFLNKKKV